MWLEESLENLYFNVNKKKEISISGLKKLKKVLIKEGLLLSQQELADEYRDNIQNMVENFYKKPKRYIKKALGILKPKIDISKLYNNNGSLENDPDMIKDIINKYFKNILRQRTFNIANSPLWQESYSTIQNIDKNIYNSVTALINSQNMSFVYMLKIIRKPKVNM